MGIWRFVSEKIFRQKSSAMIEEVKERKFFYLKHPLFPLDLCQFDPISEYALVYIDSLPSYRQLSRGSYFLPKAKAAYQLPLNFVEAQWDYLYKTLSEYKFVDGVIPRHLFKRLPGIEKVLFHTDIECLDSGIKCDMYSFPLRLRVWCLDDEPRKFDSKTMLVFEPTIIGAITAFYMSFGFNCFNSPILSKRRECERFIDQKSFGEKIDSPINIPYGLRVEIINEKNMLSAV